MVMSPWPQGAYYMLFVRTSEISDWECAYDSCTQGHEHEFERSGVAIKCYFRLRSGFVYVFDLVISLIARCYVIVTFMSVQTCI